MPPTLRPALLLLVPLIISPLAAQQTTWAPNSLERPHPPVIDPGASGSPAPRPSDAISLFDGKDLSQWVGEDSAPARWTVKNGYLEVAPGTGGIHTRRSFGDVQLHLEWASPAPAKGTGQDRGNSGVFLMSHYEVQVLHSYRSDTYADGQAGALYGQSPPLVNPSRPPGQWQSYDIVFHAPHFGPDSTVISPARATVFYNGVLVQDNVAFTGATRHAEVA